MVAEARLAAERLGFPNEDVQRLERLIKRAGLPTELPSGTSRAALLRSMRRDKKARDGRIRYALPARLGSLPSDQAWTVEIPESWVRV